MQRSRKLRASPVGFPTDNYETLCLRLYICVSVFDMNLYFARAGIVHIATLLLARPTLSSFVHAATSKRLNVLNRWWLPEGEHLRSYPLTRTSTSKGSNHIYPTTFFGLTHSEIRRMEKVTLRRYSLYVREGRSAPVHHEPKRAPYVVRPLRGRWKEDEITRRCSPSGSHQRLSTFNLFEVAACTRQERVRCARFNLFEAVRAGKVEIHNANPRKV